MYVWSAVDHHYHRHNHYHHHHHNHHSWHFTWSLSTYKWSIPFIDHQQVDDDKETTTKMFLEYCSIWKVAVPMGFSHSPYCAALRCIISIIIVIITIITKYCCHHFYNHWPLRCIIISIICIVFDHCTALCGWKWMETCESGRKWTGGDVSFSLGLPENTFSFNYWTHFSALVCPLRFVLSLSRLVLVVWDVLVVLVVWCGQTNNWCQHCRLNICFWTRENIEHQKKPLGSSDIFRFTQKPPSTKSSSSSLPLASTLALVRLHLLFKTDGDPVYTASAERNQIIDAINGSPINLQRRNAGGGIHYALEWCISILHISHISVDKYQWCSSDNSSLHDHASKHKRHNVLRHNHL